MKTLVLSILIVSSTASFAQVVPDPMSTTQPVAPSSSTLIDPASVTPAVAPADTTPATATTPGNFTAPANPTTSGGFTPPANATGPGSFTGARGRRGPGGAPGGGAPGDGGGYGQPSTAPTTEAEPIARGNGKISGVLVDSTTSKPVEFATIALISTATNKPIDGTTADGSGKFTIGKLAPGKYRLQYSFIGYKDKRSALITVDKGTDLNMGTIKLGADVRTLKEVNVVGQAAMIEEKVDRLVYNADKDITAKGGDASDIMRKVPMLSVDMDGNVSLRGSSNVTVLINNKPSTIMAASVADALKQIPADQIKTVEVITSPSAKYDAEGSAGIINIVTKKNTLQGATLDVNGGVGNRGSNLGLNGNYRVGKMGFSLSGFGRAEYNVKGAFNNDQTTKTDAGNSRTIQTANTLNQRLFGNYQLGWDYDIDKNTSLTASIRYGARNQITNQYNLLTTSYPASGYFPSISDRNVKTTDLSGTVDANITYTRTYKPQKEFSIMALYSRNNRTNDYVSDLLSNTDFQTITSRQRNDNPSYNQQTTLQIDYQTPIKTNQLVEFGAKGTFRQANSQYNYFIASGADGEYATDATRQGNTLFYDQNIAAGYLSYTLTTKSKFTIKAGARYEYTFINARFSQESTAPAADIPNYGTLVPSINISKSLGNGKLIKLAYNRRIQRPGIQFLNPNVNSSNPTNVSQGNPALSPELTDNVELSTSTNVKGIYLNASLFGRRTANSITSIRDVIVLDSASQRTAIRTQYKNVGREDAIGLNLFGNATLFSKLQLGGGIDIYHVSLTNSDPNPNYTASNSGWVIAGRLMSSVTLPNGWALQLFGGARGKQIQLQGYQSTMYFYNLGVRKEFNDKKSSLGLAAENFLNHPFVQRSETISPILSQNSSTSYYNAGVRLTFTYKIGKMSFDAPRKRSKSVEDDLKSGGDGDNQQQPAATTRLVAQVAVRVAVLDKF